MNVMHHINTLKKKGHYHINKYNKGFLKTQNRHMKKSSMLPIIKEMQVKTTMRYYLMPVRMAISTNQQTSADEDVEKRETSCAVGGNADLWETVWTFLKKLKMGLPFDLVIPLLGIYPKKPETKFKKIYSPLCLLQHYLQ